MLKLFRETGLKWLWITALAIALDQWSKSFVLNHFTFHEPYNLLPFLNVTLAYNKGAAFSFLHTASGWQNLFLGGLASVVSVIILVWLYQSSAKMKWQSIALCLILAGALGNAWDRLCYGYVIDFIDVFIGDKHFAIFNIADAAISTGAFLLMLVWLKGER